jgi:hypothetical protein
MKPPRRSCCICSRKGSFEFGIGIWNLGLGISDFGLIEGRKIRNRSQVQGSTFRVKDKEGIKDPKFSLKMLISQIIANYSALKNSIFRVANCSLKTEVSC